MRQRQRFSSGKSTAAAATSAYDCQRVELQIAKCQNVFVKLLKLSNRLLISPHQSHTATASPRRGKPFRWTILCHCNRDCSPLWLNKQLTTEYHLTNQVLCVCITTKKTPLRNAKAFLCWFVNYFNNMSKLYLLKMDTAISEMLAIILIRMLREGPTVSFKGSPTVSPTTAAS